MKNKLIKGFKIVGISIGALLLLMFLLPMLFPEKVATQIKGWANQSIEGELNFSKVRLSFFRHFPNLTLSLYDYSLTGSAPFSKDTLAAGKELAMGINLFSLFRESIEINKFYVEDSRFNILVDKDGNANYNIYKSDTSAASNTSDTASAHLNIEGIEISNSQLHYNDQSLPMLLHMDGLNYEGNGDFAHSQFELESELQADSVDFIYNGTAYIQRKQLRAELITGINTNSLSFRFAKNDILINKLPVDFSGSMTIVEDGYDIDMHVVSGTTDFGNIFSALPPEYNEWFASTTFKGRSQVTLDLEGQYRAAQQLAPNLHIHMWVNDGLIQHKAAPAPLEHFYTGIDFSMPSLNADSMELRIDSLKFLLKGNPTFFTLSSKGIHKPMVKGKLNSQLDLLLLDQALGLSNMELEGLLNMKANINGRFDGDKQLFPPTNASITLRNGFVQTSYYPQPVTNLNVDVAINGQSGTYNDLHIQLKPVSFQFEQQPFSLTADLRNLNNVAYNIAAKGTLNLGKLYQVFAIPDYGFKGMLKADLALQGTQADLMEGRYQALNNKGTLEAINWQLRSRDYPYPFEVPTASLRFDREKAWLTNTQIQYRGNSLALTGYASNFIGYYLQGSPLTGKLSVQSKKLEIDDFMELMPADSSAAADSTTASTGVVLLPRNLQLSFDAVVDEIVYGQSTIRNFGGQLQLQQGKLDMRQTRFSIAGANVQMEGSYAPQHSKNALFAAKLKADSFDVKKAYDEIPLFREMASAAQGVQGLVSLDYVLDGRLNETMYPVMPSLKGSGYLKLENVKVKGQKILGAISKKTGKDSLSQGNIKAVVIKSKIANNIMTIERTKMKVFGFRPRFEGQVSLDGRMNLKFRLGLPPFGIIGIPMTITGTSDKPVVKLRRGKEADELEEEPNEEEEVE
ncbi:AsmA family protein [Phnomibacter sp. MR]|uniref:AsmA family protein n=1 Tax=Phnomibacter sp. MR TaxID=3042318 RepID=UPI003A802155